MIVERRSGIINNRGTISPGVGVYIIIIIIIIANDRDNSYYCSLSGAKFSKTGRGMSFGAITVPGRRCNSRSLMMSVFIIDVRFFFVFFFINYYYIIAAVVVFCRSVSRGPASSASMTAVRTGKWFVTLPASPQGNGIRLPSRRPRPGVRPMCRHSDSWWPTRAATTRRGRPSKVQRRYTFWQRDYYFLFFLHDNNISNERKNNNIMPV